MRLLYLAHDLADPAVLRRQRFLRDGSARVSVIGFRRRMAGAPAGTDGPGRTIGQTQDGRLGRRIFSTLRAILSSRGWHDDLRGADVIMARTLEMLFIAVLVRRLVGLQTPIVYECLDIHRLMTRPDSVGTLLRMLEGRLLRSCALLVVSSPRFIDAYFATSHRRLPPSVLLENKLLSAELGGRGATDAPRTDGPPWRIGWFGIIRCRRSLRLLADLVRTSGGAVEVEIRGRPALDVLPEFDAVVASTPGISFCGPYDRATDLLALYGRVHFNWAIDYYEDGLNSTWLLPNRLYEGSIFGTVPLALAGVETGRWLVRQQCGLLLDDVPERALAALFGSMTAAGYADAQERVAALDPSLLLETHATAAAFVETLARLEPEGRAVGRACHQASPI